jgi:transposase InsO family protein
LLAYIQRYGIPKQVIHDNAQEFLHGEFAKICADKGIAQLRSPPYNPNKNPTEHYMEIITSTMRSLLFISGLDPNTFWEHALLQALNIQRRTALPGRCTPNETTFGRQPSVLNLRIFGCEALAFIEKDKRTKLNPKVQRHLPGYQRLPWR